MPHFFCCYLHLVKIKILILSRKVKTTKPQSLFYRTCDILFTLFQAMIQEQTTVQPLLSRILTWKNSSTMTGKTRISTLTLSLILNLVKCFLFSNIPKLCLFLGKISYLNGFCPIPYAKLGHVSVFLALTKSLNYYFQANLGPIFRTISDCNKYISFLIWIENLLMSSFNKKVGENLSYNYYFRIIFSRPGIHAMSCL